MKRICELSKGEGKEGDKGEGKGREGKEKEKEEGKGRKKRKMLRCSKRKQSCYGLGHLVTTLLIHDMSKRAVLGGVSPKGTAPFIRPCNKGANR